MKCCKNINANMNANSIEEYKARFENIYGRSSPLAKHSTLLDSNRQLYGSYNLHQVELKLHNAVPQSGSPLLCPKYDLIKPAKCPHFPVLSDILSRLL